MKNLFTNNPTLIFVIPLMFFLIIGCGGLYIAIVSPNPVPVYVWMIFVTFVLFPTFIIYSLTKGFFASEKQVKAIEEQRENLLFDDGGVSIEMPLHSATLIISWDSIETIIYTNYQTDDNAYFEFYLNEIPAYKVHENSWWLARLFPLKPKRKWVRVSDDSKQFAQLPDTVKKYLELSQSVDFSDSRKGTLVSKSVEIKDGITTTKEHWKPKQDYEPVQLIFDRQNRTLGEIDSKK